MGRHMTWAFHFHLSRKRAALSSYQFQDWLEFYHFITRISLCHHVGLHESDATCRRLGTIWNKDMLCQNQQKHDSDKRVKSDLPRFYWKTRHFSFQTSN